MSQASHERLRLLRLGDDPRVVVIQGTIWVGEVCSCGSGYADGSYRGRPCRIARQRDRLAGDWDIVTIDGKKYAHPAGTWP